MDTMKFKLMSIGFAKHYINGQNQGANVVAQAQLNNFGPITIVKSK